MERYSRQILFPPLGEAGQLRLGGARVAIVGCGALGSLQAELLARAGVGRLRLIDRDFVEASNLQRQVLFDEDDAAAALPKAIAARERLQRVNHEIAIEARVEDLTPANVDVSLAACDLVLDACDNSETRYLINDYAVQTGVPWIYGAAVASTGASFTVVPGETACLTCLFGELAASPLPLETCDTSGVLGWVAAVVASLQAGEAMKLLSGNRDALRPTLWTADLWRHEWREIGPPARDPECRTCGVRDFVHLRGESHAAVTLCGRNAVQIHERARPLALDELARRLAPHGEVRGNAYALRFTPRGDAAPIEMTVFPDGRALVKGTTDPGVARSLYARYLGG